MSEPIKRWTVNGWNGSLLQHEKGAYCLYSDYEKIATELSVEKKANAFFQSMLAILEPAIEKYQGFAVNQEFVADIAVEQTGFYRKNIGVELPYERMKRELAAALRERDEARKDQFGFVPDKDIQGLGEIPSCEIVPSGILVSWKILCLHIQKIRNETVTRNLAATKLIGELVTALKETRVELELSDVHIGDYRTLSRNLALTAASLVLQSAREFTKENK